MHKLYQAAEALGNSDLSSLIRLKGTGLHTEMSKQQQGQREGNSREITVNGKPLGNALIWVEPTAV